jgi:hypothetical protein
MHVGGLTRNRVDRDMIGDPPGQRKKSGREGVTSPELRRGALRSYIPIGANGTLLDSGGRTSRP